VTQGSQSFALGLTLTAASQLGLALGFTLTAASQLVNDYIGNLLWQWMSVTSCRN